jgi:hypothetical protein
VGPSEQLGHARGVEGTQRRARVLTRAGDGSTAQDCAGREHVEPHGAAACVVETDGADSCDDPVRGDWWEFSSCSRQQQQRRAAPR